MPTQEERLTNLEQFQRETIAAIRVQNEYLTTAMDIISQQEIDIQRTLTILEEHSAALRDQSTTLREHSTAIRALLAQLPKE